jgi:hypothetical protein
MIIIGQKCLLFSIGYIVQENRFNLCSKLDSALAENIFYATITFMKPIYSKAFSSTKWLIAIFVVCGTLYLHALRQKDLAYHQTLNQLSALEEEKQEALLQQEELRAQIESQSDPAFVEMVLKRNLGLVPEGQVKVYFRQE